MDKDNIRLYHEVLSLLCLFLLLILGYLHTTWEEQLWPIVLVKISKVRLRLSPLCAVSSNTQSVIQVLARGYEMLLFQLRVHCSPNAKCVHLTNGLSGPSAAPTGRADVHTRIR